MAVVVVAVAVVVVVVVDAPWVEGEKREAAGEGGPVGGERGRWAAAMRALQKANPASRQFKRSSPGPSPPGHRKGTAPYTTTPPTWLAMEAMAVAVARSEGGNQSRARRQGSVMATGPAMAVRIAARCWQARAQGLGDRGEAQRSTLAIRRVNTAHWVGRDTP